MDGHYTPHTHTCISVKEWTDCIQQLQLNCYEHGLSNADENRKITSFAMYLTLFLTWTIWLNTLPGVNTKVTITGEGRKETGKGKCRSGKMRLGQET